MLVNVQQMQAGSPMLHSPMMGASQSQSGPQPSSQMNPPSGPLQGYSVGMGI